MIRKVYPRLGEPITLTRDVRATFIPTAHQPEQSGHVLLGGWQVREEIRDDLPRSERTIVQYTADGLMGRYWVNRADLPKEAQA